MSREIDNKLIEKAARDYVGAYIGDSQTTSDIEAGDKVIDVEFPYTFREGDSVRVGFETEEYQIKHVDYVDNKIELESAIFRYVESGSRFTACPVIEAYKAKTDNEDNPGEDAVNRPNTPFATTEVFAVQDNMRPTQRLTDKEYQNGYEEHVTRQKTATLSVTFYDEYHKALAERFEIAISSDTLDFRVKQVLPYGVSNFTLGTEIKAHSFDNKSVSDYTINYFVEGVAPQPGQPIEKIDSTGKVGDIDTDLEAE